jgi:hypothetical protein
MEQYEFVQNLTNGAILYWSVVDDTMVDGMISYNGLLGYLAFGFAGPNASTNAMFGATIMMGKASSVYNATHGFDFDFDPVVEEHVIGTETAYRHWQSPVTTSLSRQSETLVTVVSDPSSYVVEDVFCFTSISFRTAGIFNRTFNISGTDRMIWSANGEDMFAGYHGTSRGIVLVEWSEGVVTLELKHEEGHQDENNEEDHEDDESEEDHDEDHEDHENESDHDENLDTDQEENQEESTGISNGNNALGKISYPMAIFPFFAFAIVMVYL